jgi:hypothetical protein
VAAATRTGGVGLRPPCYGYEQACEDEAERCGPLRLLLHVHQVALLARDNSDAGIQRRQ